MSTDTLGVAVVGCGRFGSVHAAAYSDFHQSRLVAVCDSDESSARALAEAYGARWTTSVEDLARDPEVAAASVATPDFAHREPCVALARAGKHLLIEKPLATSIEDARAIADAARESGVVAMVDFHNRYHPALVELKARLGRGELGRAQMLYARLSDRIEVATEWFAWAGRSGPEWFLGSHLVDLASWIFDARPVRVYAEGRRDVLASRGVDCHDSMQIHLSFQEGFATLETSWILPRGWPMVCDFQVSLQGTGGRADVDMSRQGLAVASGAGGLEHPMLLGHTPVGADHFGFFALPVRDFVRTVRAGGSPTVTVEEGLAGVETVAAALESARTGEPVGLGA